MLGSQRGGAVLALTVLGVLAAAAPAAAGAAVHHSLPDQQVPVDNPCTGQPTLLTFTDQQVLLRESLDANGKLHFVEHIRASWHTEDGFSGRFRDSFGVLDADPGTFTDFVAHQQVGFVGQDSSGRVVRFRLVFVANVTPEGLRASVDVQEASCSGRP
jgi:hypothetical protein